jgi:hypothetical protein
MENKLNNPNAFPLEYEEYNSVGILCKRQEFGMSLRDYFAAAALTGLCAHSGTMNLVNVESTVARSYEIADEMLRKREL